MLKLKTQIYQFQNLEMFSMVRDKEGFLEGNKIP